VRERLARPAFVLHGGLTREERSTALASFAQDPRGLLLATDAAAEGLNLHHHCRLVVNLELPWNPMRLEQRIGRVDRIGQRRTVHAFHLIADGTGESRLLERLRARVASAQAEFGAPDPFVDDERQAARLAMTERE
jgi:SNF2 family DNA or RNA helicase